MAPHVFGCTCFVQDLSPDLDKLSPQSIKCAFVGYFRTQKDYQCYSPTNRKYFVSVNVTFFESIPYFFPQGPITVSGSISLSLSVSLPAPAHVPDVSSPVSPTDTIELLAPTPLWDFRYVYTHRPKVLSSESVPANSSSLVEGPSPQPSAPPSDLDVSIALRKGKRSCTDYPISHFIFYDHLNLSFRQFTLSLSSVSVPRPYEKAILVPTWKQAMDEEMDVLVSQRT